MGFTRERWIDIIYIYLKKKATLIALMLDGPAGSNLSLASSADLSSMMMAWGAMGQSRILTRKSARRGHSRTYYIRYGSAGAHLFPDSVGRVQACNSGRPDVGDRHNSSTTIADPPEHACTLLFGYFLAWPRSKFTEDG